MRNKINIAIDGPAGAGKSTIAKAIARELGIAYLDTGAMYRACGLKALNLGIDCFDAEQITQMIQDTSIDITYEGGVQKVWLDGTDVTSLIRTQAGYPYHGAADLCECQKKARASAANDCGR